MLDMETHMANAYYDVHIHICQSISVHDRHTSEIIFNTFAKAMKYLYLYWREEIIGGFSDGKKKMMGQHQGVTT